jgi:hypothetical protein
MEQTEHGLAIDAAMYERWGSNTAGEARAFDVATMKRYMLKLRHGDCPLFGCEEFDMKQKSVPVSRPGTLWLYDDFYGRLPPFRPVLRRDVPTTPEVRDWLREVEALIRPEVERQMEAYRARRLYGVGPVAPDYRNVVRITGIDMGERPKRLRGAEASVKAKKSRAPQHLLKQKARLDGRR